MLQPIKWRSFLIITIFSKLPIHQLLNYQKCWLIFPHHNLTMYFLPIPVPKQMIQWFAWFVIIGHWKVSLKKQSSSAVKMLTMEAQLQGLA